MLRVTGRSWATALLGVAVAVTVGAAAVRTVQDPRTPIGHLFNSDFLNPPAFYADVVKDHYSPRTYQFSAATFAFPDLATYFAVKTVVRDTAKAVLLWEAALYMLLVLAGWWAAVSLSPRAARPAMAPAFLLVGGAYFVYCAKLFFFDAAVDLMYPVCHNGVQTCAFLGVALAAVAARAGSAGRFGAAGGLAVVCFLAAFSDRIFGLFFAVPIGVALLAVRAAGRPAPDAVLPVTWGRAVLILAAAAAGCLGGIVALKWLQAGQDDPLKGYWTGIEWKGAVGRIRSLSRTLAHECRNWNALVMLSVAWYVLGAATGVARAGGWVARKARGGPPPAPPADGFGFYQILSGCEMAVVVAVFAVSRVGVDMLGTGPAAGAWLSPPGAGGESAGQAWSTYSRYFTGPFGAALVGWAFLLGRLAGRLDLGTYRGVERVAAFGLVTAAVVAVVVDRPKDRRPLSDLRPDWVVWADTACGDRGLTDGLTDYWSAKPLTLLSRRGVRARQVIPVDWGACGVTAQHWLSNSEWYWRRPGRTAGAAEYQFVLAAPAVAAPTVPAAETIQLDAGRIAAALGEPAARLPIGPKVLMVYDRPADLKLRHFAALDPIIQRLRAQASKTGATVYPGNALQSAAGTPRTGELDRVADEGKTPAGVLAFGPYLPVKVAGPHRVTFRVASAGSPDANATLDVCLTHPGRKTDELLGKMDLPPGYDGEITIPVEVADRDADGLLQARVWYTGKGKVTLHEVRFEPPPLKP